MENNNVENEVMIIEEKIEKLVSLKKEKPLRANGVCGKAVF